MSEPVKEPTDTSTCSNSVIILLTIADQIKGNRKKTQTVESLKEILMLTLKAYVWLRHCKATRKALKFLIKHSNITLNYIQYTQKETDVNVLLDEKNIIFHGLIILKNVWMINHFCMEPPSWTT